MELTELQQTSILQLYQALYNDIAGTENLESYSLMFTERGSLARLAETISKNQGFFGRFYPNDMAPLAFAEAFVNDLIGDRAAESDKTIATEYIVNKISDGATQNELIPEITTLLSSFPATHPNWGMAAAHYIRESAARIVDNLAGNTVSSDDKVLAVNYIVDQMNSAGQSFGDMIEWAITTLDSIDYSNPIWGNAAALFDNRIEISRYYSIEKAGELNGLVKQILASISHDSATVATAKAAIDALLNNFSIDLGTLDGNNGFLIGDHSLDNGVSKMIFDLYPITVWTSQDPQNSLTQLMGVHMPNDFV